MISRSPAVKPRRSDVRTLQNVAFAHFKLRKSNEPTGLQLSRQGLYLPKMAKNAYFEATMTVLGPSIPIILEESKYFGTNISENHLGTSFALFFWLDMAPNGPEMPIIGLNDQKGKVWPFFGQRSKLFGEGMW